MAAFEEFGVMPEIIQSLRELDWVLPRDVQAECIPLILGGGDVLAASETGSGKTGAFSLPLLQIVHETLRNENVTPDSKQTQIAMSSIDRDQPIATDGTTVQSRDPESWFGIRASIGVSKGRYYYEVTVEDEGLSRIGWSTKNASMDLGTDGMGFGYGATGKKSNNKKFDPYGETFQKGDVIGACIDFEEKIIGFTKNGQYQGDAFQLPKRFDNQVFYPAIALKNAQVKVNFGQKMRDLPEDYEPMINAKPQKEQTTQRKNAARTPLAIIIEPTHELAHQTHEAINTFQKYMPPPHIQHLAAIGGSPLNPMINQLKQGCDIVTGTPGRLQELLDNGSLDLSAVKLFVLDEADHLIEGSAPFVQKVYSLLNKTNALQVLFFSATLHSPAVKKMAESMCRYPTWVDLKGKDAIPEYVDFAYFEANPEKNELRSKCQTDGIHQKDNISKNRELKNSQGIKLLKPALLVNIVDAFKMDQAMIFCRTKIDCDNLEAYFNSIGGKKGPMIDTQYSCVVVHGDRPQKERTANINAFKKGDARFLISTDLAARGIDIKELPYVINFTLPDKAEDFIHRVGRVGRAERMGLAISLVSAVPEKVWFHSCPSRGKNCHNTKLVEENGCAMWWDEPTYWQQILTRLGVTIPHLTAKYTLPENHQGAVYGQKKEGGDVDVFKGHAEQLKPIVQQLAQLEEDAQKGFWALQSKYKK